MHLSPVLWRAAGVLVVLILAWLFFCWYLQPTVGTNDHPSRLGHRYHSFSRVQPMEDSVVQSFFDRLA
ncbi:MAG TPA: hypothetical protein PLN52_01385 [Opitutaceae bacterium]|nr:hypothetical protein [Opitutaceae bacterium]